MNIVAILIVLLLPVCIISLVIVLTIRWTRGLNLKLKNLTKAERKTVRKSFVKGTLPKSKRLSAVIAVYAQDQLTFINRSARLMKFCYIFIVIIFVLVNVGFISIAVLHKLHDTRPVYNELLSIFGISCGYLSRRITRRRADKILKITADNN